MKTLFFFHVTVRLTPSLEEKVRGHSVWRNAPGESAPRRTIPLSMERNSRSDGRKCPWTSTSMLGMFLYLFFFFFFFFLRDLREIPLPFAWKCKTGQTVAGFHSSWCKRFDLGLVCHLSAGKTTRHVLSLETVHRE